MTPLKRKVLSPRVWGAEIVPRCLRGAWHRLRQGWGDDGLFEKVSIFLLRPFSCADEARVSFFSAFAVLSERDDPGELTALALRPLIRSHAPHAGANGCRDLGAKLFNGKWSPGFMLSSDQHVRFSEPRRWNYFVASLILAETFVLAGSTRPLRPRSRLPDWSLLLNSHRPALLDVEWEPPKTDEDARRLMNFSRAFLAAREAAGTADNDHRSLIDVIATVSDTRMAGVERAMTPSRAPARLRMQIKELAEGHGAFSGANVAIEMLLAMIGVEEMSDG